MAASIEYFLAPTALAKGWIDQTTAVFAHVALMHLRDRLRAPAAETLGQLGEIAEQWFNRDELGMLIELGVVASADKSR